MARIAPPHTTTSQGLHPCTPQPPRLPATRYVASRRRSLHRRPERPPPRHQRPHGRSRPPPRWRAFQQIQDAPAGVEAFLHLGQRHRSRQGHRRPLNRQIKRTAAIHEMPIGIAHRPQHRDVGNPPLAGAGRAGIEQALRIPGPLHRAPPATARTGRTESPCVRSVSLTPLLDEGSPSGDLTGNAEINPSAAPTYDQETCGATFSTVFNPRFAGSKTETDEGRTAAAASCPRRQSRSRTTSESNAARRTSRESHPNSCG